MTTNARIGLAALAAIVAVAAPVQAQVPAGGTLVVLPLENLSGEARFSWLREGAAILLTDLLAAEGELAVGRDERLRAFERLQLPPAAVLSRASAIKAGQVLGAAAVVIGSIEPAGTDLVVKARMIRIDTGRLLPEVHERGPLADPFGLFRRVARALRAGAAPLAAADAPALPPSPQAFEFYVKGLVAESVADQRALLEQALKSAPRYDRVRLALWDLHTEQGDFQRALDVVSGAPGSAPDGRDARFAAALSLVALKRFEDAFAALKGLQSEVRSAVVANTMGVVQLRRGATPQTGSATYYFHQAAEIDPTDPDYFFNLGYAYWLDRDANATIYWLREAVRRDPADGDAHLVLSAALVQMGAAAEAAREAELAGRLSPTASERDGKAAGDAVPRGLERLHDRLTAPARADTLLTTSGQRDQQALAEFHLDAGRRAFAREADREATTELRRALFNSPYLAEAHLLLGRLHLRGGRPDEAVEALKIALWSEETPAAHVALAEAYLALQDTAGARTEVDRALALDPAFAPALAMQKRLTP